MTISNLVLWIYIVLLLVGGLIGFFKAKSKISLIMSVAFAALLILTAVRGILELRFARNLEVVLMIALLLVFTMRLAKTRKFMPSGLMLICTILALVLRNVRL